MTTPLYLTVGLTQRIKHQLEVGVLQTAPFCTNRTILQLKKLVRSSVSKRYKRVKKEENENFSLVYTQSLISSRLFFFHSKTQNRPSHAVPQTHDIPPLLSHLLQLLFHNLCQQ